MPQSDSGADTVSVVDSFAEVIARHQAGILAGMGSMFAMTQDRQSSIFLKKADEIDPTQAFAMRQTAFREAPINATSAPP